MGRRLFEILIFRPFHLIAKHILIHLPYKWFVRIMKQVNLLFMFMKPKWRKRTLDRIELFERYSGNSIDKNKCLATFGVVAANYIFAARAKPGLIKAVVGVEDEQVLKEIENNKGKGMIWLTCHSMGLPLFVRILQNDIGETVYFRPLSDPTSPIEDVMQEMQDNHGFKMLRPTNIKESLEEYLERGATILTSYDVYIDKGIEVDFLGGKTLAGPGIIAIAEKLKVPILPIFVIETRPDYYEIQIKSALKMEYNNDSEFDLQKTSQNMVSEIERIILLYPEQWTWPVTTSFIRRPPPLIWKTN